MFRGRGEFIVGEEKEEMRTRMAIAGGKTRLQK